MTFPNPPCTVSAMQRNPTTYPTNSSPEPSPNRSPVRAGEESPSSEEWRPVYGFDGLYSVSSLGRVRSESRVVQRTTGAMHPVKGRILRLYPHHKSGHMMVNLCRKGVRSRWYAHRLVLEAFAGPRPRGMECRHLNGDPADNRPINLAWGTKVENEADKARHGTVPKGGSHGMSKLNKLQARIICHMARGGKWSSREIAEPFDVSMETVSAIKHGRCWAWATEDIR